MEVAEKKKMTRKTVVAALLVGCLGVAGMSAYFTDQEEHSANAKAGNINLTWVNKDLTTKNSALEDTTWKAGFDADGIMNPGDSYDFSYTVANTGSKSIDVKQQIVLKSSQEMLGSEKEYSLTITGGNDTTTVVPKIENDNKTLVYDLKDIILDGSIETETGSVSTTTDYNVRLDFDLDAKNEFMDSTVELDYQAYAKQHRNAPDAGWTSVADYEAIN